MGHGFFDGRHRQRAVSAHSVNNTSFSSPLLKKASACEYNTGVWNALSLLLSLHTYSAGAVLSICDIFAETCDYLCLFRIDQNEKRDHLGHQPNEMFSFSYFCVQVQSRGHHAERVRDGTYVGQPIQISGAPSRVLRHKLPHRGAQAEEMPRQPARSFQPKGAHACVQTRSRRVYKIIDP